MDGARLEIADEPRGFEAQAGELVGSRWILREELGRGASSIVWRATHELLGKDVAIKFLDPDAVHSGGSSRENVLERFRFEAQVSSTLATKTAEIVAVHDAGVFAELPFMVMDLVRGDSVALLIEREVMTLELVVKMARNVATALDACHDAGIAHRDTKPANILLVGSTSSFKLTDFGLAKHFGEVPTGAFVPRNTDGAMLVGTPAYMGPEAISADRTACGRGDVWSLAVTVYECLTRTLPFHGEQWPAVAVAIMNRSYVKPSAHAATLARFDAFFEKAFAEEIGERFQSARDLADAFEHAAFPPTRDRDAALAAGRIAALDAMDPARLQPRITELSVVDAVTTPDAMTARVAAPLPSRLGGTNPAASHFIEEPAGAPPMRRSLFVPSLAVVGLVALVGGWLWWSHGTEEASAGVTSSVEAHPAPPSTDVRASVPPRAEAPSPLAEHTNSSVAPQAVSAKAAVTVLVTPTSTAGATTTSAATATVAKPPSKPLSPSEVW